MAGVSKLRRTVIEAAEALGADNLERVLAAFRRVRLASADLVGSDGYGYVDPGRDKLEAVYAELLGTEAALVRPQLVSGTQALSHMLRAAVEAGQHLVVGGAVYDTLHLLLDPEGRHPFSLVRRGVRLTSVPEGEGGLDPAAWRRALDDRPDWVYLQRSRGYQRRPSWTVAQMRSWIAEAHRAGALVMVDNCYGEFTDRTEPGHWGADLLAGSLLKNPGGGLAPGGGYVAGRRRLVERVADHLYAPGLGSGIGGTGAVLRWYWQGLFYAPHAVSEALIGASEAARLFQAAGLPVDPGPEHWPRSDIVLAVTLGDRARLLTAIQAVQEVSPLDSFVAPEAAPMPGYAVPVAMAASGFVPGGSLELSADAPMEPPWTLYLQGGVMRQHAVLAARRILARLGLATP
jgi:cystathionine beta-lyase family protein involved in aluminum resistance